MTTSIGASLDLRFSALRSPQARPTTLWSALLVPRTLIPLPSAGNRLSVSTTMVVLTLLPQLPQSLRPARVPAIRVSRSRLTVADSLTTHLSCLWIPLRVVVALNRLLLLAQRNLPQQFLRRRFFSQATIPFMYSIRNQMVLPTC